MKAWFSVGSAAAWLLACSNAGQTPAPAAPPAAVSGAGRAATPAPASAGSAAPAPSAGGSATGNPAVAGRSSPASGPAGAAATPSAGRAADSGSAGSAQAGAAAIGGNAGSSGAPATGAAGGPSTEPATGTGPFPPVTNFGADGPFKSTTMTGTGPNGNYTVYHPVELAPGGAKNPIVGWMSGGATTPDLYPLLPRLATHGFVVVASNTAPGIGAEQSLGQEILAGITWAIGENDKMGSPFFGKLNTSKIASMGYSMGSLATFTIASDPRLTTTVHISGGTMAHELVNNLKQPALFLCGTPGTDACNILDATCDIAAANCDIDFMNATTPVLYGNFSGGHLGILAPPLQDQIQMEAVAWLRWQLMDDTTIKARFVGPQCGVCQDSKWKVQQKNLN